MISTTYIHQSLTYYFSPNEWMDIEIGQSCSKGLNYSLDVL